MVIISYDKKNVYNVSERLYYELDSEDCTHRCVCAMIKEFETSDYFINLPFENAILGWSEPILYSRCGNYNVCQYVPENDIGMYKEAVCTKLVQVIQDLKLDVDRSPIVPVGNQNDPPVIPKYNPSIPPNLSKEEEYHYRLLDNKKGLNELLKNLPSVYDIKADFPPQNSKYKYDEYGFPYLENYVITLKMKMDGKMRSYVVGYYTDKDKFDSVVNKMTLYIKKGKDCLDFSEL